MDLRAGEDYRQGCYGQQICRLLQKEENLQNLCCHPFLTVFVTRRQALDAAVQRLTLVFAMIWRRV
jgi:hypothetical protein